ncbi:hypothetical protein Bca4012_088092 [Brassica carinata]
MGKTTQRQTGKHCQQRHKAIEYMEEWRGIKEEEMQRLNAPSATTGTSNGNPHHNNASSAIHMALGVKIDREAE